VSDSFLLSVLAGKLNTYATGDLLSNGTNAFYVNGSYLSVADISDPLQMSKVHTRNKRKVEAVFLMSFTRFEFEPLDTLH
jgi:hypothetical protein